LGGYCILKILRALNSLSANVIFFIDAFGVSEDFSCFSRRGVRAGLEI
jgi:hypothetical protein